MHIRIGLADFSVSNYDWIDSAPLANSYFHNTIKEKPILTAICFLGLDEHNNSIINSALRDLELADISDINASISSSSVVTPDKYHPPLFWISV
jgi:hypothetical protein